MKIKIATRVLAVTCAFTYSSVSTAESGKRVSIEPLESVVFAFRTNAISSWFSALLVGTKTNAKLANGLPRNSPVCHDSGGTPIYLASTCQQLYPGLEVQPCEVDSTCKEYPANPCAGRQCIEPDPGP
jgi:hypothetical protein